MRKGRKSFSSSRGDGACGRNQFSAVLSAAEAWSLLTKVTTEAVVTEEAITPAVI
jgi:hypothetical protein